MSIQCGRAALALPMAPASAAAARTFVRAKLGALDVPDPPLEDAVLLTSELVTNVLLHAGTDIEIRLETEAELVRVEVHDGNDVSPRPSAGGSGATSGRGLFLVEQIAQDWGIDPAADGKAVWFELAIV